MPLSDVERRQLTQRIPAQLREATVLEPPLDEDGFLRVELDGAPGAAQSCPWASPYFGEPLAGDAAAVLESDGGNFWALWWPQGGQTPDDAGGGGSRWWTGAGAPSAAAGKVGDFYLASSGAFYEKTGDAVWTSRGTLLGPIGPVGPQGAASTVPGPQGPAGATGATGASGPQGVTGAQGIQGIQGATGATGSQGPQGVKGDPGSQGVQGATGATGGQGIQGVKGDPGEKWATQSGAPAGATGVLGDWALDSANGDFYEKTGASAWTLRGNLRGAQGIQGPIGVTGSTGSTGSQGVAGTPGEKWFAQAGAPAGATGIVGDWALDTTAGDVYEKTGAAAWTVRANIKGPTGATGSTGSTGATGPTGSTGPAGPAGINWLGPWSSSTTYHSGDAVSYLGSSYVAGANVTGVGQDPVTLGPPYWRPLAVKGDVGATGAPGATGPTGSTGAQGVQGVPGNPGVRGTQGPVGTTGAAGTPGSVWRSGSGAPAAGLGVVGDWYLGTANGDVHEKTAAAVWTLRDNLTGPQGIQGVQGPQGATGATGTTGSTGSAGTPGEKWPNQAGAPAGATGIVGDWSLDSSTGDYYEKTGASAWTLRGNLRGPTGAASTVPGPTGPAGSTGPAGTAGPPGADGPAGPVGPQGYDTAPIGTTISWTAKQIPDEWAIANGQRLAKLNYPDAWTLAKAEADAGNSLWTYRTSDNTFTVPNLSDKFIFAAGTHVFGENGGEETHLLLATEAAQKAVTSGTDSPDHVHGSGDAGFVTAPGVVGAPGSSYVVGGTYAATTQGASARHSHAIAGSNAVTAHNNMPPYLALAQLVKAKGVAVTSGAIVGPAGPPGYDTAPIGSLLPWTGLSAPSTEWLLARGQTASESEYPQLATFAAAEVAAGNTAWAVAGTVGSRTVTMPDMRDRFVYGTGGKTHGSKAGAEDITLGLTQIPPHVHLMTFHRAFNGAAGTAFAYLDSYAAGQDYNYNSGTPPGTGEPAGGGQPHSNMPPYMALSYIVKAKGVSANSGAIAGPPGAPGVNGGQAYVATIGDGTARVFTVAHGLGSKAVTTSVRQTASPYSEVTAEIEYTSGDTITVRTKAGDPPPTAAQYTVVVSAAGGVLTSQAMDVWHTVGAAGEPAFAGGTANESAGNPLQFRRDPLGKVQLRGRVLAPATGALTMFTLPVGYRPPVIVGYEVLRYDADTRAYVYINPAGAVIKQSAAATYLDMAVVEFDTDSVVSLPAGPKGADGGVSTTTIIGDGVSRSYPVAHGLGTRAVTVSVYDNGTLADVTGAVEFERTSTSVVTVKFSAALPPPTTGQYTVICGGPGAQPQSLITNEAWHVVGSGGGEPAFQNSWASFGGIYGPVSFRKDPFGKVQMRGVAATGATGTVMFTLPVGYRPPNFQYIPVMGDGAAAGNYVGIAADGTVTGGRVGANLYLGNVEFDTDTITSVLAGPQGPAGPAGVPGTPARVSSLPASPADGLEVHYVADAANGVLWHLRYNASSASAHKWEFVGGGYLYSSTIGASGVSGTGSSYGDITGGAGPDVVAPLAGDYEAEFGYEVQNSGAYPGIINLSAGVAGSGGPTAQPVLTAGAGSVGGNSLGRAWQAGVLTALTAGLTVRMKYLYTASGAIVYQNRMVRLRPRRVG